MKDFEEKQNIQSYPQEYTESLNYTPDGSVNDYNILNALSMVCEDLGQSYLNDGFNPFFDDFEFDEEYIIGVLENKKNAPQMVSPTFIEQGEKATKEAFENAKNNIFDTLQNLIDKLNDPSIDKKSKQKLQNIIAFLRMQMELCAKYIQKLKQDKNALQMYFNIQSVNWHLSNLLKDLYEKEYKLQENANALIKLAFENFIKQNTADQNLISQAKQIIAQNLKKAEEEKQELQQPTEQKISFKHEIKQDVLKKQPPKQDVKPQPKKPSKKDAVMGEELNPKELNELKINKPIKTENQERER